MTLYIPPFWCGVIWTVLVEVGALLVFAIVANNKQKKGKKK
jgi:hypothetical protein